MLPSIINQDFIPFQYEGIKLQEACFINGNPYFTRKAIGEFLEYSRPQEDIDKIIRRNPHIDQFSVALKLTVTDQYSKGHSHPKLGCECPKRNREINVWVYDPIGLQLIINKSNQPKALAFQIAVAHLVLAFMQGKIKPKVWGADRISAIKQILSYPPTFKRKQLVCDLAQREGVVIQTAYKWIDKFGGLKTRKGCKRHNSMAGTTKYPELKEAAQFVRAQMPSYGPKRIAAAIGRPDFFENIKRWLKAA
jgi:prophage antirepressor-like protein